MAAEDVKIVMSASGKDFSTRLVEVPGNPVPDDTDIITVTTRDGVALRAAIWSGLGSARRGTVILLQGRAEFIEKYLEVVAELRIRGFDVVTFDWRGQGGSSRLVADPHCGHVGSFDEFSLDYQAVAEHVLRDRAGPVYCLAHSMGGCIALLGARDGWLKVDALILSAPMVALRLVQWPRLTRSLVATLTWAGFGSTIIPSGQTQSISTMPFEGNRLCQDPARYARNADLARLLDWGAVGSPSVRWLGAAYEAMDRLAEPGFASAIAVPTLVIGGSEDGICSMEAIEAFAREMPRATCLLVEGARHEVLMERDAMRAAFWEAFDAFVAENATRPLRVTA